MNNIIANLNPFNFADRNAAPGSGWGTGSRDTLPSSGAMLASETAYQAGVYRPMFLPLFGPQVPSINTPYVTEAIPGSAYDTGVAGNGAFTSQFAGRAARLYADFMVEPYTYSAARDEDLTPFGLKLKQWWAGVSAKIVNPFVTGPADTVDTTGKVADQTGTVKIAAAIALTAAAGVAVVALARK